MQNFTTMTDFVNNAKAGTLPKIQSEVSKVQTTAQAAVPVSSNVVNPPVENIQIKTAPSIDTVELNKKLQKAKRKNGIIEKVYDGIKNFTGLGVGSKKIQKAINEGKIDAKEAEGQISDYRVSQERSAQTAGDVLSVLAAGGTFFGIKNVAVKKVAGYKLNKSLVKKAVTSFGDKKAKDIYKKADSLINGNKKMVALIAVISALVGGMTKLWALKINRIGSDRFKFDKDEKLTKKERYQERDFLKKEKKSANRRNFLTGAVNGLLMPVMTLGGAIGTPLYMAGNILSRYFFAEKNDEKKKTPKGFLKSIVKNPVTTIAGAALIAIPLFKRGQYSKILAQNTNTVVQNLQKAKLNKINTGKTTYQQLEDILMDDKSIRSIVHSWNMSVDEKIHALTNENIFAIKFEQIKGSGGFLQGFFGGGEYELIKALKENCPPSRTVEEAQKLVSKTFGKKYKLEKCLGVGTVAETYLAKGEDGKEVCIKMLKKGIDAEKLEADKKKFLDIIKAHFAGQPDKQDEMNYLIKNMENITEGISREIDFHNEMEAAKRLAKHTTKAKVVQPIQVKDGLYIMEKADGISLEALTRLNDLFTKRKITEISLSELKKTASKLQKTINSGSAAEKEAAKIQLAMNNKAIEEIQSKINDIEQQITAVKAKTPQFKNIELNKAETDFMLDQYMQVLTEQFNKTERNGKTIHGDIHPGNIFIDVDALKARKGKVFTLIDTGNTIEQTSEQAMRAINLTKYLKNADVENLAAYALDGAKLPKGLSKEKALETMQKELRRIFFDNKTAIGPMNNDNFTAISNDIMKRMNIIPSDTQGNLFKAQTSANQSFNDLVEMFMSNILTKLADDVSNGKNKVKAGISAGKDAIATKLKFDNMKSSQEKQNLKLLSPADRIRLRKSKSTPATNSVEYLTYKYKQKIKDGGFF